MNGALIPALSKVHTNMDENFAKIITQSRILNIKRFNQILYSVHKI